MIDRTGADVGSPARCVPDRGRPGRSPPTVEAVDRRWGGVLVLVVAVIAALAGSGRTKQVAGTADIAAIPGPPEVGACVLNPTDWNSRLPAGEPAVAADGTIFLSVATGPCRSARYGEVAGLVADGLDYRAPAGSDKWDDPNSPDRQCTDLVDAYIGNSAGPGTGPASWYPAPEVSAMLLGPSALQQRFGARWLVCAVVGHAGSSSGPRYTGSVRDVMHTLRFPSALAQCLDAVPTAAAVVPVDCAEPHEVELMASSYTDDPRATDRPALAASCPEVAASLTGMLDPTAGGRLRVSTVTNNLPVYGDGGTMDPDHMVDVQSFCVIEAIGGHRLTGPLLGLGGGAVPLG